MPKLAPLVDLSTQDCPEEKTSIVFPTCAFPKVKECCFLFHFISGPELRRVNVSSKVLETISEAGLRWKARLLVQVALQSPRGRRFCSPVVGAVRGRNRCVSSVRNQPLEGGDCAQADG